MLAVTALRRRRETGHVACAHLREDPLEGDGGDVVTLVHDDVPIPGDEVRHVVLAHQALDHRNVDLSGDAMHSAPDAPDGRRDDAKERGQLR